MKIKYLKYTWILLIIIHSSVFAQPDALQRLREKIILLTDRSLYSTGEYIHFVSRQVSAEAADIENLSKVLYVDLITPDGQIIRSSKFPLDNNTANGAIKIPEDALSGMYYLNAYTKWLRNYDLSATTYLSVRIINPFELDHLPTDTLAGRTNIREDGKMQKKLEDVNISSSGNEFDIRQAVSLQLKNTSDGKQGKNLILSIVPSGAMQDQVVNRMMDSYSLSTDLRFIPETRGISLTGSVQNTLDGSAAAFSPVFLTLLDSERSFYPAVTDSTGNFYFSLPDYRSARDLFISVKNTGNEKLKVLVDSDFASERLVLPSFKLELDSLEYYTALHVARNQQLRSQYYSMDIMEGESGEFGRMFYGQPVKSVEITEFIDLPSLEEYFLELLPMVSVLRTKGVPSFRVNGPQAEMKIYDPLVIIDGVAVHDNSAVLAINPQNISRIEIVDRPWIRGDQIFGGIISIISRKNDFAGVELPESGLFLTYRFFEPAHPTPQSFTPESPNIPDTRNTLFWEPDMVLSPGEKKEISFRAPDIQGDYCVILREIDADGEVRRQNWPFTIK